MKSTPVLLIAALAPFAHAQEKLPDYPRKPIRIIVGIAPAGGLDLMTRLGAQKITERWGTTVVVDNRPGGGTVIAMDLVSTAAPDGYTLLAASETFMLNGVFRRTRYDVRKTFAPIVQLTTQPYMLLVHPSVPAKTIRELIAVARTKPGALNYGSQGPGTVGHIGMERLKLLAGMDITHVPYKGAAPAFLDLLAGNIQVTFSTVITAGPQMKSGKVRALGYSGTKRSALYPELPTIAEAGVPGYSLHNTYGYFAPAGTPVAIIRAINSVVSQGMNTPETVAALAKDGTEVIAPMTPEELKSKLDREYAEIEKVVQTLKLKID